MACLPWVINTRLLPKKAWYSSSEILCLAIRAALSNLYCRLIFPDICNLLSLSLLKGKLSNVYQAERTISQPPLALIRLELGWLNYFSLLLIVITYCWHSFVDFKSWQWVVTFCLWQSKSGDHLNLNLLLASITHLLLASITYLLLAAFISFRTWRSIQAPLFSSC